MKEKMSFGSCLEYVRSDYYRVWGRREDSLPRMWAMTWLDVGFRFMFWFRFSKCKNMLLGGRQGLCIGI